MSIPAPLSTVTVLFLCADCSALVVCSDPACEKHQKKFIENTKPNPTKTAGLPSLILTCATICIRAGASVASLSMSDMTWRRSALRSPDGLSDSLPVSAKLTMRSTDRSTDNTATKISSEKASKEIS